MTETRKEKGDFWVHISGQMTMSTKRVKVGEKGEPVQDILFILWLDFVVDQSLGFKEDGVRDVEPFEPVDEEHNVVAGLEGSCRDQRRQEGQS